MTESKYKQRSRTMMVKFTCSRCGLEKIEPMEKHDIKGEDIRKDMWLICPPPDWVDMPFGELLCPECAKAYRDFIVNGQRRAEARKQVGAKR